MELFGKDKNEYKEQAVKLAQEIDGHKPAEDHLNDNNNQGRGIES